MKCALWLLCCTVLVLTTSGQAWSRANEAERASERSQWIALLAALWPERVGAFIGQDEEADDWAEADRRFMWMRALVDALRPPAAVSALTPPASPMADRDSVSTVVADLVGEGQPVSPLASVTRGSLSWPVRGVVVPARMSDRNQLPGLALSTPPGASVQAAAGGWVVFSGILRGLGQVIIVSHGNQCHTVYACLAQVEVAVGDAVSRGRVLGWTGLCPPARGPGVYFELRFREKALNPAEWLAASP